MGFMISSPFSIPHAIFMSHPLSLQSDSLVYQVAKRLEVTPHQDLAKVVVEASKKPELFLLIGVGVIWSVPHHLGEVAFVLLYPHCALNHSAEHLGSSLVLITLSQLSTLIGSSE